MKKIRKHPFDALIDRGPWPIGLIPGTGPYPRGLVMKLIQTWPSLGEQILEHIEIDANPWEGSS